MNWTGPRPSSPPLVTFAQMQAQLRIDDTDEQDYITDLVDAATEYAELAMQTSLLSRTITAVYYEATLATYWGTTARTAGELYLPRGPIQSITSIVDAQSTVITDFQLIGHGAMDTIQIFKTWTPPLTITYVAGYGSDVTDVPADIRMMIRAHVASWWRTRESISDRGMLPVPHSLELAYSLRKRSSYVG